MGPGMDWREVKVWGKEVTQVLRLEKHMKFEFSYWQHVFFHPDPWGNDPTSSWNHQPVVHKTHKGLVVCVIYVNHGHVFSKNLQKAWEVSIPQSKRRFYFPRVTSRTPTKCQLGQCHWKCRGVVGSNSLGIPLSEDDWGVQSLPQQGI